MIKKGFTLAEVLITLTVVGVIAAITLPTFTASTTNAQIGPKLGKAASMLEQASTSMVNKFYVDSLTDADLVTLSSTTPTTAALFNTELPKFLKVSASEGGFVAKDGVHYKFDNTDGNVIAGEPPHTQRIGTVKIDINGIDDSTKAGKQNPPNLDGADQFYFSWWNDGSLRPKGATGWDGTANSAPGGSTHWSTKCPVDGIPSDASYCAGHLFENNMKVLYK